MRILITGGAGYVGSALVPLLIERGDQVRVLDLFWFGEDVFPSVAGHPRFETIKGDLRDEALVARSVEGVDAVIHLACISNDPSFELNPGLGKSINFDAFGPLVMAAKRARVRRFIYASSSSVYGVKEEPDVHERLPLEPLTDYSRFKADCERVLLEAREPGFETITIRPATVCGYAPRLRLDLAVNILTHHAFKNRVIKVFGGAQYRPNIHIDDMCELYVAALGWPATIADGQTYNAGYQNRTIADIAAMVRAGVGDDVRIETTETDDKRSYRISAERVRRDLGFVPKRTIEDASRDLVAAFEAGRVPNSMTDDRYYNIRTMKQLQIG